MDTSESCENLFISLKATNPATGRASPSTPSRTIIGSTSEKEARIRGMNAISTISGIPMISHHFNLPEYRLMQSDPTAAITRTATYGEAVRVRMKSSMAIPAMNISHPESPSR